MWQLGLLCLFWVIWKARNLIAFEDCGLSIQKLKVSFVYLLWSETNLWIKDGPSCQRIALLSTLLSLF